MGETRTRLLLRAHGFTTHSQVPVAAANGWAFANLDLQLVGTRVGIEFDGHGKYDAAGALLAEKQREDRIRAVGCLPVRLEWSDLSAPQEFLRRLEAALQADRTHVARHAVGPCRFPERNLLRAPHVCQAPH